MIAERGHCFIKKEKPYVVDGQHVSLEDYRKTKVDQFVTRVPKGHKSVLQAHAETQGESLNSFINRAANETMQRDTKKADS